MAQYEFDAVRFLAGRARAARAMRNFADENNFIQCAHKIVKLDKEVKRLKKIVEAPWKCDVCGNYLGNDSVCLEEDNGQSNDNA